MGKSSDIPELVVESSQRSQETAGVLCILGFCSCNGRRRSTMIEPCPLSSSSYYGSSSFYYGAREYVFTRSSNVPSPGSFPEFKRDDNDRHGNDDSGNWWDGSLYY